LKLEEKSRKKWNTRTGVKDELQAFEKDDHVCAEEKDLLHAATT